MHMYLPGLAAVTVLFLSSISAIGESLDNFQGGQRQALTASGFDWSGAYIGLQSGYLTGDTNVNRLNPSGVLKSWTPNPDGLAGGLYIGHNWEYGQNLVFGVEAEYNWSGADGSDQVITTGGVTLVETIDLQIKGTAAIRGRIGYAMDRTLFYATGGWAWIDYDSVFSPVLNGTPFRTLASSNNDQGWTLGIGIEHAFDDRWVGRIDYRYSNFGDAEYSAFPQPHLFGDFETHDIRAGIAVRF